MKIPALLASLLVFASSCFALEDTAKNRAAQADRYLLATPPKEVFEDMATNMAQNIPAAQREQFMTLLTKKLDLVALAEAMRSQLIKVFTADELKALADFYSSPEGKSSMKKMGVYMGGLMPVIQAQIQKAMQGMRESSPASRDTP